MGGLVDGIRNLPKSTPRGSGSPTVFVRIRRALATVGLQIYRIGLPRSRLDSKLAVVLARGFSFLELSREVNLVDC